MITVELEERSYDIVFDTLGNIGTQFSVLLKNKIEISSVFVVSNSVVGPLYATQVVESFTQAGFATKYLEISDGESNKTIDNYLKLVELLLSNGIQRSSIVLGLGGGVTTDIVGFAAATVLRGVSFATVPTTLLAMVDASVGGKTGVNTSHGKNLLGAFWQPKMVFIDLNVLKTLTDAEFRCGMGEIIKHSIIDNEKTFLVENVNLSHLDWLLKYGRKIASRSEDSIPFLRQAVVRSCQVKAQVVAADETESGYRAILNFGHTVAHAIEFVQGIHAKSMTKLRHGEAVAIGCLAETELSMFLGTLKDDTLIAKLRECLQICGLPTGIKGLCLDSLVAATLKDKKRSQEYIKVTQPVREGEIKLVKLKPETLKFAFEKVSDNSV